MNQEFSRCFCCPWRASPRSTSSVRQRPSTRRRLLCEREGGKLWKISLCGPIVIADPATKTIATNQPAPDGSAAGRSGIR